MADLKTQMIEFSANGQSVPGYLAMPDDKNMHPGIVVIQEWWGLVPHIMNVAERFAREGFVALVPDLYHGKKSTEPDEARKLVMALDHRRAVEEIAASARYLKGMDRITPKKVGVVGFCMGGGLALAAAAHDGDVGATVDFYGRPLDANDTAKLHAPVLGLYAEHDHGTTPEMLKAFEQELAKSKVPYEIHVYPGTQHAFFNDTREAYNAEAAKDTWQKTLAWFRKYLV